MTVQIKQGGLSSRVEGFGPQIDVRSRRVIAERDDVGGVDDPRIGAVVACGVEGWLPVGFVFQPVHHVGFAGRQRVRRGELHASIVEVPEKLPGRSGTVGADEDSVPDQGTCFVEEAVG